MKFRLSEEDAQTLDCPQDIEFDESRLTGREAIAMKKLTGWSMERFSQAFAGERVIDDDGNQVWELDDTGAVARDEAGNRVPLCSVDAEAILIGVWLAVRRTVGDRPWKGFDVNLIPMMQGDEVGEGKSAGGIDDGAGADDGFDQYVDDLEEDYHRYMPVMCDVFGITPWDYYDRLSYVDWQALKSYIDRQNERR